MWHLELVREFTAERDDILDCKALLKLPDSEQSFCARIMGAAAIPDFSPAREYDFQVSIIPHSIAFFKDESEMRKTLSDETTALGALVPVGMYVRMLNSEDEQFTTDILMTRIAAEITTGDVRFMIADKTPVGEFLHLVLNTHFGELDLAVSQNQYETKELTSLCSGGMIAVVNGIISAKLIKREKADNND